MDECDSRFQTPNESEFQLSVAMKWWYNCDENNDNNDERVTVPFSIWKILFGGNVNFVL
jgi:hypothetical protein